MSRTWSMPVHAFAFYFRAAAHACVILFFQTPVVLSGIGYVTLLAMFIVFVATQVGTAGNTVF